MGHTALLRVVPEARLVETGDGLAADVGTGTPLEVRSRGDGVLTAHIADGRTAMRMRMVRDREGRLYILPQGRASLFEDPAAGSG